MKCRPAFFSLFALATLSLGAPLALAHPGHDGHELTWDFDHLAAHPLATVGCLLTVSALAWVGWRFLRPVADAQTETTKVDRRDR